MNFNVNPPQRKSRKTFATDTLKKITCRLQYYRRILNQPEPINEKQKLQRQRIQSKYDRDMKVRALLNKAVKNLYI